MIKQIGKTALILRLITICSMAQSQSMQLSETIYWVGTSKDGSSFTLELFPSGVVRFVPITGVVSKGTWKQKGKLIEMELNKKYVRLTGMIDGNQMAGESLNKKGAHWTWVATKQPIVIETATPAYPPLALAARVSGPAWIELEIGAKGEVIAIQSIKGPPIIREEAEKAARRYRFQPVTEAGTRFARLTFIFTRLDVNEEKVKIISPLVQSPYQVEVRRGWSVLQLERELKVGRR